jgi:16S rRNA (cytosine967-C5)-methyltransferase
MVVLCAELSSSLKHNVTDARKTILKVLKTVNGGVKLDTAISRIVNNRSARRDRAYVTTVIKTVFRNRSLLDYQISVYAKRPTAGIQTGLLDILRVATAELLLLRTADYAAVNEAVAAAGVEYGKKAAGFVNAVLRRIAEAREPALPGSDDEIEFLSVKYSHPEWLVKRWLKRFGRTECEALLAVNNTDAPLYAVHNPLLSTRCETAAAIREADAETETGPLETLRIDLRGKTIADIPALNDGRALIVDPSSTIGVRALSPKPGSTVLDMCAGAGGKTWQLAWTAGPLSKVLAADNSTSKIRLLAAGISEYKGDSVIPIAADSTKPLVRKADYILIDAPCSNTGVIRRKPDVRWRLEENDLTGFAALQLALLSEGARTLAPGGKLAYQTCSTEPEENEYVVEAVLAAFPELRLEKPGADIFEPCIDGYYIRTWPHRHGLNGAFVAVVRKE